MALINIRREQHPLFNSVVLDRIFQHFSVRNLKNVRLVCKFWDNIASPFLQSGSKVNLIRGRGEMEARKSSFKNFIAYIETLSVEEIFFRNYHIEHWILNERREKNLHRFWLKCGPTMKELHLGNIIFYEVETIRNVLYYWTPCLESLRIEDCLFYAVIQENIPPKCEEYLHKEDFDEDYVFFDYYDHIDVEQLKNVERDPNVPCNLGLKSLHYEQWEDEVLPLAWEEVFAAFPNLKTLKLPAYISEDVISDILNDASGLQLEYLAFYKSRQGESTLTDGHLVQIRDFRKTLVHFEMCLGRNVSFHGLEVAISEHSNALKTLNLYFPNSNSCTTFSTLKVYAIFPFKKISFPKLTTLTVSQEILRGESFPQCFQKMSALKTLKLWDASNEFNWEEPMDNIFEDDDNTSLSSSNSDQKVKPLLVSLKNFSCGYVVKSCEFYDHVFSQCPNLTVLKAPLNDEQIRIVYKHLKLIEEMTVYDRYLTDQGITGNPLVLTEYTEWSPNCQRSFGYIGDLKKLCKFTLQYWKYDGITDASVYHGFIDVANLGFLRLTKTQISDTALHDLAAKSSLVTLITPKLSKGDAL